MEITVIKQTIAMSRDETLIEKSQKTYGVSFVFDESWNGFTKTAHFQAGSVTSSVALVDDKCNIPAKCLEKPGFMLKVLVEGVKDGEEKSTPWCLTSRILYETTIDVPNGPSHQCPTTPTEPTGEVGRLCNDFAEVLGEYPEDELKGKTLSDVMGEVCDEVGLTATDEEVADVLNDVWGSSEEP